MSSSNLLRFATFNLKHGATESGYLGNPDAVAQACQDINADILALQEVDRRVWRSSFANLTEVAAEATGMQAVFARTIRLQGGSYGNALLIRGDIVEVEILMLRGGRRHVPPLGISKRGLLPEPRSAVLATANNRGREIAVAATHLAVEKPVALTQLTEVLGKLSCRPGPRVLLGDLNQRVSAFRSVAQAHAMSPVGRVLTNPAETPTKQIDHILVNGLEVRNTEARLMAISDHRALIVDVD